MTEFYLAMSSRLSDRTAAAVMTACAIVCAFVVRAKTRRTADQPVTRRRTTIVVWGGLTLLFLVMAIDKAAPFITSVAVPLRKALHASGLYQQRQVYQSGLLLMTAFASGLALGVIGTVTRAAWKTHIPALLALALLFTYILMRATSHHLTDQLFSWRLGDFTLGGTIEAGAVALAAFTALTDLSTPRGEEQHHV